MVVIGSNKFLIFTEIPNPSGDGGELMSIYISSGFLKLIGTLEILGGAALLLNRFVPIGLTLITAIMFNAIVFHALHDPMGIGPAALCLLLSILLIFLNNKKFNSFWS